MTAFILSKIAERQKGGDMPYYKEGDVDGDWNSPRGKKIKRWLFAAGVIIFIIIAVFRR